MLMTLSDQIAGFSVEVSDENISGCKSILCRFCLCFLQTFLDDDPIQEYLLPPKMNIKSTFKLACLQSDKTLERKPSGEELSGYDLSVLNIKQFGPAPPARPLNKPNNILKDYTGMRATVMGILLTRLARYDQYDLTL